MFTLPPALISPATVSAAGGGDALKRNFDTVAWIFWCALEALPVLVGTQPTVTTFRSFGLTPLVTVTNARPICVPLTMIGIPVLPSYGAGTVPGSGSGIPLRSVGLLRAQMARSRPDSATDRA
jgi:hypothetical protein